MKTEEITKSNFIQRSSLATLWGWIVCRYRGYLASPA